MFSHSLDHVDWNSRLFSGDLLTEINRMKAQPGLDMSVGGAELAATFIEHDLVDEFHVYVFPILLGGGKPMFPRLPWEHKLNLLETKVFTSGVTLLSYARK